MYCFFSDIVFAVYVLSFTDSVPENRGQKNILLGTCEKAVVSKTSFALNHFSASLKLLW